MKNLYSRNIIGKIAIVLTILFIVMIFLKMMGTIHILTFSIVAIGIIAFVLSIISLLKYKDKSVMNLFSIVVGLLIILIIILQII